MPSGSFEERRHLAVAVATEVRELDRAPLVVGQHLERGPHVLGDGELDDLALEVVPGLRAAGARAAPHAPGATTRPGRRRWRGCGPSPCRYARSDPRPGSKLLRVVPEAEEHLLDDLLGQRPIVEDPHREPEGGVAVAAVGLGQRLLAEPGDGDDQRGVARLASGRRPPRPRVRSRRAVRMAWLGGVNLRVFSTSPNFRISGGPPHEQPPPDGGDPHPRPGGPHLRARGLGHPQRLGRRGHQGRAHHPRRRRPGPGVHRHGDLRRRRVADPRARQPRQAQPRARPQPGRRPRHPLPARRDLRRLPHQQDAERAGEAEDRRRRHPRAQPEHHLRVGARLRRAWSRPRRRRVRRDLATGTAAPAA